MIRRKNSVSLARVSTAIEEDVDPNRYIVNLADCMLVMMVGLLVALVARFGVDLQAPDEEITGAEISMDANGDGDIDDGFEQAGTVYRDSSTGRYYFVEDER